MRRGYNNYSAGPFNISARIAAGGYVPHQTINVEFDVNNNDTQQAILSFYVRLFRVRINCNAFVHDLCIVFQFIFNIYFRKLFTLNRKVVNIKKYRTQI